MSTAVHITWHGAQINFGDLPPYLTYGLNLLINVHIEQYLHLWNKYPKRIVLKKDIEKRKICCLSSLSLPSIFLDAVRAKRKRRRSRERSGARRGRGRTGSGAQPVLTRSSRRRRGKSGSGRDIRMPRMMTGGNVWRTHAVAKLFFLI